MSTNKQKFGGSAASVTTDQETGSVGINNDIPQEALDITGSIRQSGVTNADVLAADADGKVVSGETLPYNLLITTSSTPFMQSHSLVVQRYFLGSRKATLSALITRIQSLNISQAWKLEMMLRMFSFEKTKNEI